MESLTPEEKAKGHELLDKFIGAEMKVALATTEEVILFFNYVY